MGRHLVVGDFVYEHTMTEKDHYVVLGRLLRGHYLQF